MIMIEIPRSELVIRFTSLFSKFHMKRTFGGSLFIPFHALIGWLSLLTAVAIENIYTISVWIVPFSSFGNHFNVLRCENFIYFLSYLFYIFKIKVVKY